VGDTVRETQWEKHSERERYVATDGQRRNDVAPTTHLEEVLNHPGERRELQRRRGVQTRCQPLLRERHLGLEQPRASRQQLEVPDGAPP
jgi:hypothetical protein